MTKLASRLLAMLIHLDRADASYSVGSHDDDGKARSLGNDLRWLRDRVAERLTAEAPKINLPAAEDEPVVAAWQRYSDRLGWTFVDADYARQLAAHGVKVRPLFVHPALDGNGRAAAATEAARG